MKIFGIESSCDESALALFDSEKGIIEECINTQIALHSEYGGIVPDLASREHLSNFAPLLKTMKNIDFKEIHAFAVTHGPGLAGCLALGISFAKALAVQWNKPIVPINHLRGHLFSAFIPNFDESPTFFIKNADMLFPHLALVVSGGNTLLVSVNKNHEITILAQTVDDAAGEAFDKGAKLLGMPYPGGALIEKHALLAKHFNTFNFPKGENIKREPRFSFSGLKTSLRYRLEKMTEAEIRENFSEICADYQNAIITQLCEKVRFFLNTNQFKSFGVSGGVSNNKTLRAALAARAMKKNIPFLSAYPKHTGDNASMIAFAAWFDKQMRTVTPHINFTFAPSLTIDKL